MKKIRNIANQVVCADALAGLRCLPDECVQVCITSPPYWGLRDYEHEGQLGLEPDFKNYIRKLCDIFDEVKRVLKKNGTCWVNLGDTYAGSGKGVSGKNSKERFNFKKKPKEENELPNKCLCQIPNRFAIEMCERGWILRNEIIWKKPNAMPSSVMDRFTVNFEKVFFFVKSKNYYFNQQLEEYVSPLNRWGGNLVKRLKGSDKYGMKQRIREYRPNERGRNMRCVWKMNTTSFNGSHFAVFPEGLPERCIKAGSCKGDAVLDPFFGSGTTGLVAKKGGRKFIGIELNPEYVTLAEKRLRQEVLDI